MERADRRMWFERIDFAGYGNLSGEKIEFQKNKLNLVVETNDYCKATIISALWTILYGFPENSEYVGDWTKKEVRRPRAGTQMPFIASMDVSVQGRVFKIIREFAEGLAQVVDRKGGMTDVTAEFARTGGPDQIGLHMTGLTRELFLRCSYLTPDQIPDYAEAGLMTQVAERSEERHLFDSKAALAVLDSFLGQHWYNGRKQKLDAILRELDGRDDELEDSIRAHEEAMRSTGEGLESASPGDRYFRLLRSAIDTDVRLIEAQEKISKMDGLIKSVEQSGQLSTLSDEQVRYVDQLWVRRQTRLDDYNRLHETLGPSLEGLEAQEQQMAVSWKGLTGMGSQDAQIVGSLAVKLRTVQSELQELEKRKASEVSRLHGQNVNLAGLEGTRKTLLSLEGRDYDDARSYANLIANINEQLAERERNVESLRQIINDVESQSKGQKGFFGFGGGAAKKKEKEQAERDLEKYSRELVDLNNKVRALTTKLDTIATRLGLSGSDELLNTLKNYSTESGTLKDLDNLDHLIAIRQSSLQKVESELQHYFEKTERGSQEVTVDNAMKLCEQMNKYVEESRRMESDSVSIRQDRQQLAFLTSELDNVNTELDQIFTGCGLSADQQTLEQRYAEFSRLIDTAQKSSALRQELVNMAGESPEAAYEQLAADAGEWESRRKELLSELLQVVDAALTAQSPEAGTSLKELLAASLNTTSTPGALRKEREELIQHVRSHLRRFDADYSKLVDELEQVQQEMKQMTKLKNALLVAKDEIETLAMDAEILDGPVLNGIAAELMDHLGLPWSIQQLEEQLKRSLSENPESPAPLNDPAFTARQFWYGRDLCLQILSDQSLPIFCLLSHNDLDDQALLAFVRNLLGIAALGQQIFLFCGQQKRNQFILNNLSESEKELLHFSRRMPIQSDALSGM